MSTQVMTPNAARWAEITARKNALRRRAGEAAQAAYHAHFTQRSRELGGFTEKTRDQIISEATCIARATRRNIYIAAGYRACGPDCDNLVTPGFDRCPDHTPISV